jgi:YidC/Oxa1 family membrane protein insertase
MDKNNVIGLVLIAIILVGYSIYTFNTAPKPTPKPGTEQTQTIDSLATNAADSTLASTDITNDSTLAIAIDSALVNADSLNANKLVQRFGSFATAGSGVADTLVLENENLRIVLSTYGANLESIELKNFKTYDQQPLFLSKPGDQKLQFDLSNSFSTADLYYTTDGIETNKDGQRIVLSATTSNGGKLQHVFTLPSKGFLLDYNLVLDNLGKDLPRNTSDILGSWTRNVPQAEKKKDLENGKTKLFYRDDIDGVENLSESEDDALTHEGNASWVSYSQAFFNTTLIAGADNQFDDLKFASNLAKQEGYLKEFTTAMSIPHNGTGTQTYDLQYYLGPNRYQTLKKMDIDLEETINLGVGIFAWVAIFNKWIIIPIFNFLEGFISNYGIIILILTLIIKVVLFPLTYKSYLSQAKMKVLKPELDALKEKYKDDQGKFTQEQMKLWGKAGVNPLGGCLPTLLQMPILVAMYSFFPSSIELRQEKFLWADDLSTYDSIWNLPFDIPFYGDHVSLFTLLMTITSIIYAVSNARMTGQQEGPMKYMPYIFPIMLLGIFNSFPAALTYYYFLANVISYLQQWIIRQFFIDEDKLHQQMQDKKAKPENPNSFGNRFRKAMEQAQNAQAEQKKPVNKKK